MRRQGRIRRGNIRPGSESRVRKSAWMRRVPNKMALRLVLVLCLIAASKPSKAQALQPGASLPQLQGTTLDGANIALPDASTGKVTLLIFSFSKAAGEQATVWNKRFIQDYPQ